MLKSLLIGLLGASVSTAAPAGAVDPIAYAPYTPKGYPTTFAKWGAKAVARIDGYRKVAAERAASNPACDKVEVSELSDIRSAPPNKIVIFVDCTNLQRFYFTAAELDAGMAPVSIQQKTAAIPDSELVARCEATVRRALRFPSSFDKSWFTTNVYRAPTGNVVVTFDFSAKNGLGLDLPQRARCVTDDRGQHPPEITDR